MKVWLHKYRALIGYVFIVVVFAIALELHTAHVEHVTSKRDERSCQQRHLLADNQRDVIIALLHDIRIEHDVAQRLPHIIARLETDLGKIEADLVIPC